MFTALSIVCIFCAASTLSLNYLFSDAFAQAEFEIKTTQTNLEQEYREELDKWMLLAYEGDIEAQFKVGVLFTNNQFNQPDFEQAVYWYKQAARQDHILAQYNLGHQYLTGVGVQKNELTAMQWWQKAAESDHALAQFNIGRAYFLGIGFEKDHALSKYWFKRAAQNEEPKSIDILQELGWADGEVAAKPNKPKSDNRKITEKETASVAVSQTNKDRIASGWKTNTKKSSPALTSRITPIEIEPINKTSDTAAEDIAAKNITAEDIAVEDISVNDVLVEDVVAVDVAEKKTTDTPKSHRQSNVLAKTNLKPDSSSTQNQSKAIASTTKKTTKTKADTLPVPPTLTQKTQKPNQASTVAKIPLYTNPEVRSILIAVTNNRKALTVSGRKGEWSIVVSKIGFPVWIHNNFLRVNNKIGVVTGQAVNARSVPIITRGSIVGSFNQGERVKILTTRGLWYRVIAPLRFKAWVKTDDLNQTKVTTSAPTKRPNVTKELGIDAQKPDVEIKTIEIKAANIKAIEVKEKPPVVDIVINAKPIPKEDETLSADENGWLFSQSADGYTLQLASFDDPIKEQEFLNNAKRIKRSKLHKFTVKNDGIVWTYFLYDSYSTIDKAEKARAKIKQKLAWRRNIGKIQQNRCLAWSNQKPIPIEYREYCSL